MTILAESIERFRTLFRSNAPSHGSFVIRGREESGKVVGKAQTFRGVPDLKKYEAHLVGTSSGLGITPVQTDGTAWFGAIDCDDRNIDPFVLAGRIRVAGIPLVLCRSKSGGAHLYLFGAEPLDAGVLQTTLESWLPALGLNATTEVFPKQARLSPQGTGSWINLPYHDAAQTIRPALVGEDWVSLERFLGEAERSRISNARLVSLSSQASSNSRRGMVSDVVVEGNRNNSLNKHLFFLRANGADDETIRREAERYNASSLSPPLPGGEVAHVVQSVLKVEPGQGDAPSIASRLDEIVDWFNRSFAVCIIGGHFRVLWERPDGSFDVLTKQAFVDFHKNRRVWGGEKPLDAAPLWLKHPRRRQYVGLAFEPGQSTSADTYNLFRGWAVVPRKGDVSRFLEHINENVAAGNPNHAAWILAWIADIFQRPTRKKGTALVLTGPQGSGKTIVGDILSKLLGRHYARASQEAHITGRFNSHHEGLLLLHSDEAVFAGDHAAAGKLKDFITSSDQLLERKGVDVVKIANYARVLVTSEQPWVVAASRQERRFAVFALGTRHVQDHGFFGDLMNEMENGGFEALLHHFLTVPYDEDALRTIPSTSALDDQKILTMRPEEGWLLDLLTNGILPEDKDGLGTCPSESLYSSYIAHGQMRSVGRKHAETAVGIFLRQVLGEAIGKRQEGSGAGRMVVRDFASLAECRRRFAAWMKWSSYHWDGPDEWLPDPRATSGEGRSDAF